MKALAATLKTLRNEAAIALLTGLLTFGLCLLLARGATVAAVGFALAAGLAAGALDAFYFHLLFRLREGRVQAAEKRYHREMDDTRRRLLDGSLRLREALIRRFEEDYRRSLATHPDSAAKRQLREAKARLQARLWTIEWVLTGDEFAAATTTAKTDGDILEQWTERVDELVDARRQVQREQNGFSGVVNRWRPTRLARQTRETLADWEAASRHPGAAQDGAAAPLVSNSGTLRRS